MPQKNLVQQQGDVLIYKMKALPIGLKKLKPINGRFILAEGEATGHAHAIPFTKDMDLYEKEDGTLYMKVKAPVVLSHEEHAAQTIEPGLFEIGIIREVDPFSRAVRNVAD